MVTSNFRYLLGIDEAGRGPIAGPVSVGLVAIDLMQIANLDEYFAGVKDSKKLSAKKRNFWLVKLVELKKAEKLNFVATLVSNQVIDNRGISAAIRHGIKECLAKIACPPSECLVLLDGGLKAPEIYLTQKTIIRGDETEPVIALASILAKVTRDRWLEGLAKKYPNYALEKHKGYGTEAHYAAIAEFGITPIHRKSFLSRLNLNLK